MAGYTIGESGSKVKKIQNFMSGLGYDTAGETSGTYGTGTSAAVKQFQTDYGLNPTGDFDADTLAKYWDVNNGRVSKVTPGGTTATAEPVEEGLQTMAGKALPTYSPNETVQQAQAVTSQYDNIIAGLLDKIANREPFRYDVNGDALYQQYKDMYTQGGQMAMKDATGQAAALTGGYGNTWAQNAGQQAYQQYMTQLANKVPELAEQAYGRYRDEGDELMQQYSMYGQERNNARDIYENERNFDYGVFRDDLSAQQQANKNAYDLAFTMLSNGIQPSAALLEASGISAQDAKAITADYQAKQKAAAAAAAAKKSGGSGGSSKKQGKGTQPDESMIRKALAIYNTQGQRAYDAYIDMQEALGYNVYVIDDYVQKYGNYVTGNDMSR
jgi:hypothetical protein